MANRATETEVKEIINTDLTEDQITPFLKSANILVTEVLSDEGYSDNLLKEIERWLAAHFVAIRDPQIAREKIGDVDVIYHGKSDLGLNHTPYGQQAMIMDYNGKLQVLQDGKQPIDAEVKAIA